MRDLLPLHFANIFGIGYLINNDADCINIFLILLLFVSLNIYLIAALM